MLRPGNFKQLIHFLTLSCAVIGAGPALAAGTGQAGADQSPAERGAYLAKLAGCESCHTTGGGAPYAGGYTLQSSFGPIVTPNITPDRATGIGSWDYAEFEGALRHGMNEEGEPLYPAMPYTHYTKMKDEDVKDLWAYLQTVKPVSQDVKVNRLPFPFDIRANLLVWQKLFFAEGRFQPNPSANQTVERGRYLVQALGHCGACHTPRNLLGAEITDRALKGARIETWYAPDISNDPDSAIRDWTIDELTAFLAGKHDVLNQPPVGSMAKVVGELSTVKESDRRAIATYLKSLSSKQESTESASAEPAATSSGGSAGHSLYLANCSGCHGKDGKGEVGVAARLADNGAIAAAQPDTIISVLLKGVEPRDGYGVMPSFADALSDAEIAAVANYIRTSLGNDAPANADGDRVAEIRDAIGPPKGVVSRASFCPTVPSGEVDDKTRERVGSLVDAGRSAVEDESRLRKLWQGYEDRKPGLDASARLVALESAYCFRAAPATTSRAELIDRTLAFTMQLGSLTGGGG